MAQLPNPFNLSQAEYERLFELPAIDEVTMSILLMGDPGAGPHDFQACGDRLNTDMNDSIMRTLHSTSHLVKLFERLPDIYVVGTGIQQAALWNVLPISAKKWAVDGIYVQAGYCTDEFPGCGHQIANDAMMICDAAVTTAGSFEPKDNVPVRLPDQFASTWNAAIGDLFQSRRAVWCRELVDHRNLVLIVCRAILMDRDPEDEYGKFIKAGGKYFLEYPRLCP
ncbi:hypothetical protein HZB60_12300 [candidate division KSB1 bacterium]|nr:hypothetical protein [candidate division KSB1 bacterium]